VIGLSHIIRATIGMPTKALAPFKVTPRRIRARVALLEELISQYAKPMLRGDFTAWQRSEFYAQSSWHEAARTMDEGAREEWRERTRLSEIREKAENAWKTRRYHEVVSLYDSIVKYLTPSEAKKLSIARKRIPD